VLSLWGVGISESYLFWVFNGYKTYIDATPLMP
jgi:hypothetical protein